MSYLMFLLACYVVAKANVDFPVDGNTMLILAILTAGEVISWRSGK